MKSFILRKQVLYEPRFSPEKRVVYGYKIYPAVDTSLPMEMICPLIAEKVPESIVAYIDKLSAQNRHGFFDLAYDLSKMTYIERGDEEKFYGREVIRIFVDRKKHSRIINHYEGEDRIRPTLSKNSEESFTLSWEESGKQHLDSDMTKTSCDCLATIKSPEYPMYLPPELNIDKTYKLETSSGEIICHPVFLPDQKPHLTVVFYRRFPNIPGDYNNFLVCSEFPFLYLSG